MYNKYLVHQFNLKTNIFLFKKLIGIGYIMKINDLNFLLKYIKQKHKISHKTKQYFY